MKKVMYAAPELEILEVMVEKGFEVSPGYVGGGNFDLDGGGD